MYGILTYIWNWSNWSLTIPDMDPTGIYMFFSSHLFERILGGSGAEDAACPITGAIFVQWKVGWMWRVNTMQWPHAVTWTPIRKPICSGCMDAVLLSSTFSSRKPNFRFFKYWLLISMCFDSCWVRWNPHFSLVFFHRHSYVQAMLQNNKNNLFIAMYFGKDDWSYPPWN